jgi:hypothetical protein
MENYHVDNLRVQKMSQSESQLEVTFLTWFVVSGLFTTVAFLTIRGGDSLLFFNIFMILAILSLILTVTDYVIDRIKFVDDGKKIKITLDLLLVITLLFLLAVIGLMISVNYKKMKNVKQAKCIKQSNEERKTVGIINR